MIYSPEPLVYHHHGRKTASDVSRLNRQYIIGRGAFYAKHIARGDRTVLRLAYWKALNTVKRLAGSSFARRPAGNEWRRLAWLARGLAYGLRTGERRAPALCAS